MTKEEMKLLALIGATIADNDIDIDEYIDEDEENEDYIDEDIEEYDEDIEENEDDDDSIFDDEDLLITTDKELDGTDIVIEAPCQYISPVNMCPKKMLRITKRTGKR